MYINQLQGRVSILIPVYNRERYIYDCVESALNQTYSNLEIIIVDNCSTDNTWRICQDLACRDSRIRTFRNDTNIGPVRNWKRCIDEATGEYGKILWSDDKIAPDFLEKTISFFHTTEDVGFVFTQPEIFNDDTNKKNSKYFIGKTNTYSTDKYINDVLFGDDIPVSPGCALFKMVDLRQNLVIDVPNKAGSDFAMHAIGNDLLIFLLIARHYSKFAFVNEKLSFFRAHSDSISTKSGNGELVILYDLAKAFYVENFRKDLMIKLNTRIWIDLKRYRSLNNLKLKSIKDFYMNNSFTGIDKFFATKMILLKIRTTLRRSFQKR